MKKINLKNKLIISFLVMFALITSVCYASTNYRYYTDEEITNYTKFDITDLNYSNIKNTKIVDASEKVYDFGDLFTDEEEAELQGLINDLISQINYDFAVVTLRDVDANDYTDQVFADDFYDYNDFGCGDFRDGILMLINLRNDVSGNRYVYFSTTGNAILTFDDYRISDLVNYFIDNSGIGEETPTYAHGVKAVINNVKFYYELGIPSSNRDAYLDEYGNYVYEPGYYRSQMSVLDKFKSGCVVCLIVAVIAALIFNAYHSGKLKNVNKATSANLYLKEDSVKFSKVEDTFVSTHTSSYRITSDSSSGGGGSSSHSSSSGSSHGGGGGHF